MNAFSLCINLKRILNITTAFSLVLITYTSYALEELGVLGSVEKARPYYEQFILKSKDQLNHTITLTSKDQARIDQWTAQHQYYDSGLTAGQFNPIAIKENGERIVQPLCLIANDEVSIAWLKRRQRQLLKIKPVCYLVRTRANTDIQAIKTLLPGLMIVKINPQFMITTYGIPHYPALISRKGIEQ